MERPAAHAATPSARTAAANPIGRMSRIQKSAGYRHDDARGLLHGTLRQGDPA